MALTPAEKQKRYRDRLKAKEKAQPDAAATYLKRPFHEFLNEERWNEVAVYMNWAGMPFPTFDDDSDPGWEEEHDGEYRGSVGRAERVIGALLDTASELARMVNEYKKEEIDRAIVELETRLDNHNARKSAMREIVRLSDLRKQLERQVRWPLPQFKTKGDGPDPMRAQPVRNLRLSDRTLPP